ncbi:MAG: mechanosensitive ion channel [Polyangiales bacterium]
MRLELLALDHVTSSLAGVWALLPSALREVLAAGFKVVLTVALARLVLRAVPRLERVVVGRASQSEGRRDASRSMVEHQLRVETLVRVTGSVARALIAGVATVTVLAAVGADITPLLAGAGIAGVAVGFGAQSIVKDFFAGFFILLENQFRVGDTVTVGTVTGVVEEMTLRVTLVRDAQGTLHFLPNGGISTVANRTHAWNRATVDLVVPVTVSATAARELLRAVADDARARVTDDGAELAEVSVEGPLDHTDKGATWRLQVRCAPPAVFTVRAAMIDALHAALMVEKDATAFQWTLAVARRAKEPRPEASPPEDPGAMRRV